MNVYYFKFLILRIFDHNNSLKIIFSFYFFRLILRLMSSKPNLNHVNQKNLNTSNRLDIHSFRKTISMLELIIDALGEFKGYYEKRFNFSKLAEVLGIPKSDIDDVISLILKFQDKFDTVFNDYYLRKPSVGNKIYFTLEKKPAPIPKEVKVSKNQAPIRFKEREW